jgi:tetratricopeptide (TPR) repeat protein
VLAQFEDDEFGEQEEQLCTPESLVTPYDKFYNIETPLNDVRMWFSFGSEYYKNKNYPSCLPYLWKVFIHDTAKYARASIRKIADSYFQLQKADSTLIACYRGLEKFPDHITLHYFAGFIQDNVGKFRCAIPHYEALVEDNPKKAEYLEKLAFLYFKDENEKAMQVQEQLVNLDPTNGEYNNTLAQYTDYFLGAGGALEARKKAYENDPQNMDFAIQYGKAAYDAGEYKAALVPLAAVIKKDAKNTEALEYSAMCCESLEDYTAANNDYKKILEVTPDNADIMCAIANNYKNMNQFSNGRYWTNKALQAKPGYGLAYMGMAEIYERAVTHCQNKENRGRKYDDGLVYELAYNQYRKALNDPAFRSKARARMGGLKPVLPTDEEVFMNQNRKKLKMKCYTSWINQ